MKIQKNYLLVLFRVPALLLWIIVLPLIFFLARALKLEWHREVPHYFHRGMCFIFGLRARYSGTEHLQKPVLFVSNHISYLDIFPLGRIRAHFIAKSEVASWPVLGTYAQFQNTLFFERKSGRAKQQLEIMRNQLQHGTSLILFPEGTSTDGIHVEPFKSSLFASADLQSPRVPIQPITIAYVGQGGGLMDQSARDHFAWYGTMPFGPHAAALLPLKSVDVKIHFHPVCYLDQFASRKECADYCQAQVAEKLQEWMSTTASQSNQTETVRI